MITVSRIEPDRRTPPPTDYVTASLTPIAYLAEWFVNACAVGMVRSPVVEGAEMMPNAYDVAPQRLPRSR
jgi:hypothetical protein